MDNSNRNESFEYWVLLIAEWSQEGTESVIVSSIAVVDRLGESVTKGGWEVSPIISLS